MTDANDSEPRARPIGINHVALDVGDIDAALDFYGSLFEFVLRGRGESSAFVDFGDQFLALSEVEDVGESPDDSDERANSDDHGHFGLVVDDPDLVERRLADAEVEPLSTDGPDFRDPWGNYVQVVAYENVQFTKADHVLVGMGLSDLDKSESAIAELAEKGLAPK